MSRYLIILATLLAVTISLFGSAKTLYAQSFAIPWHTIDSGGGYSAGGTFELNGTVGQHDAGATMTGGNFELAGGFWTASASVVPTLPDSFKLADGVLAGGGLSDLFASDDQRFEINPSPTNNLLKQRIDLIVQSTSPTNTPTDFSFQLESSMSGGPSGDVIQTVELFNYVTNTRELVDTRAVANNDVSIVIAPAGDVTRFVNQFNGEITAIVIWKSESFAGTPFTWSIDVDQAVWLVTD